MAVATVGNFFSIPHSQIYAEPERLAEAGLLSVRREETGRRRKHYTLTARGRKALESWLESPTEEMYELRDLALLELALGSDAKALARAQLPAHEERLKLCTRQRLIASQRQLEQRQVGPFVHLLGR